MLTSAKPTSAAKVKPAAKLDPELEQRIDDNITTDASKPYYRNVLKELALENPQNTQP